MLEKFSVKRSADSDDVLRAIQGQFKIVQTVGDADATIEDIKSGGLVLIDTAATSARTITLPAPAKGLFLSIIWTVASDAEATVVEVPSGALLGSVLAQNGSGTTIVQSDGSDTKITVNDDIEPGCRLEFVSDGTNWIVSGTVMSGDANPAFS